MAKLTKKRIQKLWNGLSLREGAGGVAEDKKFNNSLCVMEATAYIAGDYKEENGNWRLYDNPECVCPTLTACFMSLNDAVSEERRNQLLEFVPRIIDTQKARFNERFTKKLLKWAIDSGEDLTYSQAQFMKIKSYKLTFDKKTRRWSPSSIYVKLQEAGNDVANYVYESGKWEEFIDFLDKNLPEPVETYNGQQIDKRIEDLVERWVFTHPEEHQAWLKEQAEEKEKAAA